MIKVGLWNRLRVVKAVDFGLYLDGGEAGEILLPTRFVPEGAEPEQELDVFLYHDSESRLIATTEKPIGVVGEIVGLECVGTTAQGAFLNWGLMKDLFVAKSQMVNKMVEGEKYVVAIYQDVPTGRVAATEKFLQLLDNETLSVKEGDEVKLVVWRQSDIGYVVIINSRHTGVLHFSDVFRNVEVGDNLEGFIKTIREENKIDVAIGKKGYERVSGEGEKILELLKNNDGYLPYNDKSDPEEIYGFFGMSKKTFKMAIGALYKEGIITFAQTGIQLLEK